MSDEIIFYTNPMSRGQVVRWMLEEVGVPYRQVLINFDGEQNGAYLKINPMRKVPAIVHGGHIVTEVAAICAYLADAFPEAGLLPATDARADYYRWLFFASGPLEHAVSNHAFNWNPEGRQQGIIGYGDYDRTIDTLEQAVTGKTFIAGQHFTAADVYVGAALIFGTQFGTIPQRPAFQAYIAGLMARPAFNHARAIDQSLIEAQKTQDNVL